MEVAFAVVETAGSNTVVALVNTVIVEMGTVVVVSGNIVVVSFVDIAVAVEFKIGMVVEYIPEEKIFS